MVTKWRPTEFNCLYVIPDLHGNFSALEKILNRILPLRKSDGGQDKLVFLGDYLDRHIDTPKLLDLLIQVKGEDPDNITFLRGNHEEMFLVCLDELPSISKNDIAKVWRQNGGDETILGYLYRNNQFDLLPSDLELSKLKELVPTEHIDFLKSTQDYFQFENYIFIHGGCNPFIPLTEHNPSVFYWDRKLLEYVKKNIRLKNPLGWEPNIIVCGHSGPNILVHDNYLMLDAGSPEKLLIAELRSRESGILEKGKKRMVMSKLENTILKPAAFQRVENAKNITDS